jgi:hypothetical protein
LHQLYFFFLLCVLEEIIDCSADDPFSRFILTINVPVVYIYGAGHNDFEAGKFILRAMEGGSALKIKTFLGLEMATSKASAIWAQKLQYLAGCFQH